MKSRSIMPIALQETLLSLRPGPRVLAIVGALTAAAVLTGCAAENQAASALGPAAGMSEATATKGGDDRTGQYDVVTNWWKAAPDHDEEWSWGQVAGVAVDTADRILAVTRGDWPANRREPRDGRLRRTNFIVVADGDGNIVEQWSQWDSILTLPHQIYISPYDPERHVWVIDSGGADGHHQVLKFSNDGSELVMQLGDTDHATTRAEARANPNPGPFTYGWPSKLAFLPDGTFLLADGDWNSRVIKYTEDGEFISEFGSLGDGPGEFDLLHGLAVDRDRRIYVGDRSNDRIQVFSEDGEFIEEWPDIYDPVNIYIDEDDWVWVISARLNRILKYNTDGELQYHWGTYGQTAGTWEGGLSRPHQLDMDEDGALYIASYDGGWVNKFMPKPGADVSKLLGKRLLLH